MMKSLIYLVAILAVLINFSDKSYAIEFTTLADQSSGRRQDFGPIWIYHSPQRKFMYYLAFLNGKLQRIVGAPCSPDDPSCFDLR
jgi:hypothetical protein